jgi:hypothetical protein
MTEVRLSDEAVSHLKRLANGPGPLSNVPELADLWALKFVMGSNSTAHITQRGKAFILRRLENETSPSD